MKRIGRGSAVGDYYVERLVRGGSGGAVYRAEQPGLRRTVALHVPVASPGSEAAARFLEKAQLLAGLDHPNLLPVYEVGETEEHPYAAVRDASGHRLDELLREGPLAPARAIAIGEQVAAALEALQAADATPAALTASSVVVAAENGNDHVYLSPLDVVVDAPLEAATRKRSAAGDSDPSVAGLARLLTTMVTGSEVDGTAQEQLPGKLRGSSNAGSRRREPIRLPARS